MEDLPDEVLRMILELVPSRDILGSVVKVCQRWADLVEQHTVVVGRFKDLARLHRRTKNIRLTTRITPFRIFLVFTPTMCPYLRELVIYAANPLAVSHFILLEKLPFLEHLDIFLRDRVLDTQLLPVMVKLKSFVINEIVSARVLRGLAESKMLRALYMYGRSLYYPRKEIIFVLQARRYHIRELTLRCTELSDVAYTTIGLCEGLTHLQLYSCWLMTGVGAYAVTRPKNLTLLHVSGSHLVRTQSLAIFIDHLPPNVEELNLSMSWFADSHISSLINQLPRLRVLELWKCRLTQNGVLLLAQYLKHLTTLDLDMLLTNEQILKLDKHPSLLYLRCLTEWAVQNNPYMAFKEKPNSDIKQVVTKNIKVVGCEERYPFRYFRGHGEGYRGVLYYHWTQNVHLVPLDRGFFPPFDDEDEFH